MPALPIDRVGSALTGLKSGLGTGLKYLLGEKQAPWLMPAFGAAAAAPIVGYELDGTRRAEAKQKLDEQTRLEAATKMAKFAALTSLARKQASDTSLAPYPAMRPQAPHAVLSPTTPPAPAPNAQLTAYPKIRAAGLRAALTPATK